MQGKFTFTELHLVVSRHKVTQGDLSFQKTRPCEQGNWDTWMVLDPWDQV